MEPKPGHLGPEYGSQFADGAVAAAYPLRPAYPAGVFDTLTGLVRGDRRVVLDAGAGTGDLARRLAALVERVDAVDPSAPMIARGRSLPGGDHPRLRWIEGRAETAPLDPPYGLVTCGESLHWLEWRDVMPRFRDALVGGGFVAVVERRNLPQPWDDEMFRLINVYSTNLNYRRYDLIDELARRGLFREVGRHETPPDEVRQTIAEYIEVIHSRNGFSRDRMTAEAAAAFDAAMAALLDPFAVGGTLRYPVAGEVVWGEPAPAG